MSDGKFIDKPPDGIEGWRRVWQEKLSYRGRMAPAFFRSVEKVVEAVMHPFVSRQRDFNIVLVDLLRDVRTDLTDIRRDYLTDLKDLRREIARLNELVPAVADRNDALIAALDQKIETIAARQRDLTTPLLERGADSRTATDFVYRRFEEALRGSEKSVSRELEPYADLAAAAQPVIDIGCGRGEFLRLCRDRGVKASGYDTNERSVADLRAAGLDVELRGIPDCFAGHADGSLGAVFASHVVEHLPFELLRAFMQGSARVLRSGGLLMIETPNADSVAMAASDFWRDPTHLAPRPAATLVVLGRELGFDVQEISRQHPFEEGRKLELPPDADPALRALVDQLNERLYAPQDLRLILRKI